MLTLEQLKVVLPLAGKKAGIFLPALNAAMVEFGITTPARQAAFLAQIGHESGQLRWVRELASGEAYDTGRLAKNLGNTPEADGDGLRYKGRGLIQITGTDNYRKCGQALDLDLLTSPELLETPENACRSAGWFWRARGLNEMADKGDFGRITKIINGGKNGYEDRWEIYLRACKTLGVDNHA